MKLQFSAVSLLLALAAAAANARMIHPFQPQTEADLAPRYDYIGELFLNFIKEQLLEDGELSLPIR